MATLPLAYGLIVNHPPVVELYSKKLQEAGLVGTSEVRSWQVSSHGKAMDQVPLRPRTHGSFAL